MLLDKKYYWKIFIYSTCWFTVHLRALNSLLCRENSSSFENLDVCWIYYMNIFLYMVFFSIQMRALKNLLCREKCFKISLTSLVIILDLDVFKNCIWLFDLMIQYWLYSRTVTKYLLNQTISCLCKQPVLCSLIWSWFCFMPMFLTIFALEKTLSWLFSVRD